MRFLNSNRTTPEGAPERKGVDTGGGESLTEGGCGQKAARVVCSAHSIAAAAANGKQYSDRDGYTATSKPVAAKAAKSILSTTTQYTKRKQSTRKHEYDNTFTENSAPTTECGETSNLQHVRERLRLVDVDETVKAQHLPLRRRVRVGDVDEPLRRLLFFIGWVLCDGRMAQSQTKYSNMTTQQHGRDGNNNKRGDGHNNRRVSKLPEGNKRIVSETSVSQSGGVTVLKLVAQRRAKLLKHRSLIL